VTPIPANGGCTSDNNRAQRYHEGSGIHGNFKVEREEGELSPNGDFEEDNFVCFEATAADVPKVKDSSAIRQYQVRTGEEACGEAAVNLLMARSALVKIMRRKRRMPTMMTRMPRLKVRVRLKEWLTHMI